MSRYISVRESVEGIPALGTVEEESASRGANRRAAAANARGRAAQGDDDQTLMDRPSHAPGKAPGGNEALYSAFDQLHQVAQVFEKGFDSPAVLVVGHQTDGKSALVEAFLGFQFNHVGGGTKTRRPITLHMKYNAACTQPTCYLIEDLQEQEMNLEELQDYIEQENVRLEREQQFWGKEIVVKIEYRYCPNLTIIDTPGLISAAPGKNNMGLQGLSRQVEAMVRQKMEQKEYIILCLEDTSDWTNATTRRMVMQVDPTLSRTVCVSTKLDTKIPQFARGSDVELFLQPPQLEPGMMGGAPFFTSVPSGRVGSQRDSVFRTNEHFREAVGEREQQDVAEVEAKLGRRLTAWERAHVGVGQLRRFLEQLLQRRYLETVPSIVPLLEKEYRNAQSRLEACTSEIAGLSHDQLRTRGRLFVDHFLTKLSSILRGSVSAPVDKFGETLADEHLRGGVFELPGGKPLPTPESLPNAGMRLFGGAQFHRAMNEFRLAVGQMQCPDITREDIVNACGVDELHDGVNYMRTACVIAVGKARDMFEPFLHQLGVRLSHVLRRLLPIAVFLLQRDNQLMTSHESFLKRVGSIYHSFIEEVEHSCKSRCLEDLHSTTRYVTWSLHTKQARSLKSMLSKVKLPDSARPSDKGGKDHAGASGTSLISDLLEATLWNRQLTATSEEVVAALVCQIFEGIRDHVVQAAELKFNCFFLMPLVDEFPAHLRSRIEEAFEDDVDAVFDVGAARLAVGMRARALQAEVTQVESLQRKFASIHSKLVQQQPYDAANPMPTLPELSSMSLSLNDSMVGLAQIKAENTKLTRDQQRRTAEKEAKPQQQQAPAVTTTPRAPVAAPSAGRDHGSKADTAPVADNHSTTPRHPANSPATFSSSSTSNANNAAGMGAGTAVPATPPASGLAAAAALAGSASSLVGMAAAAGAVPPSERRPGPGGLPKFQPMQHPDAPPRSKAITMEKDKGSGIPVPTLAAQTMAK